MPALYLADGTLSVDAPQMQKPEIAKETIILSGSCSAMTNAQVSEYIARGAPEYLLDPLSLIETGLDPVLAWLAEQDLTKAPLIYATAAPGNVKAAQRAIGVAKVGDLIEQTLASCAVAARDAGARRIIVAGGETSGAVTQALCVTQLDIGVEIASGVPWTFCHSAGHQIALTLKSGNFGAPTFFHDAQARLDNL